MHSIAVLIGAMPMTASSGVGPLRLSDDSSLVTDDPAKAQVLND